MLTIKTNGKPRGIIYGFELTEKQRKEFDWVSPEDIDNETFVCYKGQLYNIGEFMRCDNAAGFSGWHGYYSEGFFSGILLRYSSDNETVIIGRYYC